MILRSHIIPRHLWVLSKLLVQWKFLFLLKPENEAGHKIGFTIWSKDRRREATLVLTVFALQLCANLALPPLRYLQNSACLHSALVLPWALSWFRWHIRKARTRSKDSTQQKESQISWGVSCAWLLGCCLNSKSKQSSPSTSPTTKARFLQEISTSAWSHRCGSSGLGWIRDPPLIKWILSKFIWSVTPLSENTLVLSADPISCKQLPLASTESSLQKHNYNEHWSFIFK